MNQQKDNGLRTLLTWTFIALLLSILAAVFGVQLVIDLFDPGPTP